MHVDWTSFAAPIVCAVIAQLLEVNPQLDPSAIREILFSTAERLTVIAAEPHGYGVIQPRKAVMKALKRELWWSNIARWILTRNEIQSGFIYNMNMLRK